MSNLERKDLVYDRLTEVIDEIIWEFLKENIPEIHRRLRQHGKSKNIRDFLKYIGEAADWSLFNDCFTNGIRFTDIDGLIERNGYFLLGEVKQSGVSVPTGQEKCFKRLQETKAFTIVTIWGTTADPKKLHVYYLDGGNKPIEPVDFDYFHTFVANWYKQVDKLDPFKETIFTRKEVNNLEEENRFLRERETELIKLKEEYKQLEEENEQLKQKRVKEQIIKRAIGKQSDNGDRNKKMTEEQISISSFLDAQR